VSNAPIRLGRLDELDDPGCREFTSGEGDWPVRGFVVRRANAVYAYENYCMHAGHPLNWMPDRFLTKDGGAIICASHGAMYDIATGRCIAGPCRGQSLRRIDCAVRNDSIYVTLPRL
jgi:nitrite reductase/ring-hydroxylating ferredoxin subunit